MRQTVLIIDDSPDVHDLLDVRLRPEGLTLLHASDGVRGFEEASTKQPDLILLDVDMPGQGGFEVCERLKADPCTRDIPVIFLTGETDLASKVRGFDIGAVDYVLKPFEPAELRARVRAALRTKRYQDLLARWAKIDGLTGLGNRAHFTERLAEACELASRHDRPLALVMLDVDHFKRLNDTQGHPFGDQVLTRIGEVILANVRSTDVACRYGGEEIAIIAPETTLEEGMSLAERLRAGVAEMGLRSHGEVIHVTASLGVAACGGASRRPCAPPALVERADAALYRAKHQGRDRVCEG